MATVLITVIGASIAFLLYFLFALSQDRPAAPRRATVLMLDGSVPKRGRPAPRLRLHLFPRPALQTVPRVHSRLKIVQKERLG